MFWLIAGAMGSLSFAPTDGVFCVGDEAKRMIIVKAVSFNYGLSDRAMPNADSQLSIIHGIRLALHYLHSH